jgi:tetratricopeptide (TPR) repeat protein
LLGVETIACAQDMPALPQLALENTPDDEAAGLGLDASPIRALEQTTADVREHLRKQGLMQTRLLQLQTSLQQTEVSWVRIKREQSRQMSMQLAALEASAFLGSLATDMNDEIRAARNDRTNVNFNAAQAGQQLREVALAKAQADLNVLSRSEEIRQLDTVSFAVVQRRMNTIQEMIDLHQKWLQWQVDYAGFLLRYWPHTDPERRFSEEEVRERLQVLLQAPETDYAAMIACSLLHERLGDLDEAWTWLERAAQGPVFFESTVLHLRLFLLSSMKKHREAKILMARIAKLESLSPCDLWIKARWLAGENSWGNAESEWKKLTAEKDFRIPAHRSLSLLHLRRGDANSSAREKAFKEATTALDLTPEPDWFSYFVIANACAAMQRTDDAIAYLKKADELASGENKELCQKLSEAIDQQKFLVWDMTRRCVPAP